MGSTTHDFSSTTLTSTSPAAHALPNFDWHGILDPVAGTPRLTEAVIATSSALFGADGADPLLDHATPLAAIFRLTRYRSDLELVGMGKDAAVFYDRVFERAVKIYCSKVDLGAQASAAFGALGAEFHTRNGYDPLKFSMWRLGLIGMELDFRVRGHSNITDLDGALKVPAVYGYGAFTCGGFTYFVQSAEWVRDPALPKELWGEAGRALLAVSQRGLFIDLESPQNFLMAERDPLTVTYLDMLYPDLTHTSIAGSGSRFNDLNLSGMREPGEVRLWLGLTS